MYHFGSWSSKFSLVPSILCRCSLGFCLFDWVLQICYFCRCWQSDENKHNWIGPFSKIHIVPTLQRRPRSCLCVLRNGRKWSPPALELIMESLDWTGWIRLQTGRWERVGRDRLDTRPLDRESTGSVQCQCEVRSWIVPQDSRNLSWSWQRLRDFQTWGGLVSKVAGRGES